MKKTSLSLSLTALLVASLSLTAMQQEWEQEYWYTNEHANFEKAGKETALTLLHATILKAEDNLTTPPPALCPMLVLLDPELAEQSGISYRNARLFYQSLQAELATFTPETIRNFFPYDEECATTQCELLLYVCQTQLSSSSYEEWAGFNGAAFWKNELNELLAMIKNLSSLSRKSLEGTLSPRKLIKDAIEASTCDAFLLSAVTLERQLDSGDVTHHELDALREQLSTLLECKRTADFFSAGSQELAYLRTVLLLGTKIKDFLLDSEKLLNDRIPRAYLHTYHVPFEDDLDEATQNLLVCLAYDMQDDRDDITWLAQCYASSTRVKEFLHNLETCVGNRPYTCGVLWLYEKLKQSFITRVNHERLSYKSAEDDTAEETTALAIPSADEIRHRYGIFK